MIEAEKRVELAALIMFLSVIGLLGTLVFGAIAVGCATSTSTPGPFAKCNPVMTRCNPADYPPLTATLPKSPIPPAASRWVEIYGKDTP